jgi:hypothetical protein
MRHLRLLPVALTLLATSCRAADSEQPRRGIGEACRKQSDCIEGAACAYGTCDFAAPCRVTTTSAEGESTITTRFDSRGREIGLEEVRGGEVVRREEGTWSGDGRTATWKGWDGPGASRPPDRRWTMRHDEAGDLVEIVTEFGEESKEIQRFMWSDDWSCRLPGMVVEVNGLTSVSRGTCDGDLARFEHVDASGKVGHTREYVFNDGRVAERLTILGATVSGYSRMRMKLERDARGAMQGYTIDLHDDGTVNDRATYDLGCWVVEGQRVRHVAR